jgi:hypothetical protein
MKKLIFLLLITFGLLQSSPAQEPQNLNDYVFKSGDILEYEVSKQGKTYRLIITLTGKTFIDSKIIDAISFNWETSEDPIRKGAITISKEGRANASTYQADLLPGMVTLRDKSCLWLSQSDLQSLFSPTGTSMDVGDGGKKQYKIMEGSESYSFLFKGKPGYISSFRAKSVSGNLFNFCPTMNSNGLILFLNIGWTMRLKEVK